LAENLNFQHLAENLRNLSLPLTPLEAYLCQRFCGGWHALCILAGRSTEFCDSDVITKSRKSTELIQNGTKPYSYMYTQTKSKWNSSCHDCL